MSISLMSDCLSSTLMAQSYAYPPSLIQHRPLQHGRERLHPATLKLRHHFFLTRVKIVYQEVLTGAVQSVDIQVDRYLQEELVNP